MILTNLLLFILSAVFIVASGTYLVKSLLKIARFLKISEFTAAFIIMAIATSLPELFVGISSAISKVPALSLGNIIGANILNLTLVTGIFILLSKGIKIQSKRIARDTFYITGMFILLVVLFLIGNSLSRIDGAILVLAFIFNSYRILKRKEKIKKVILEEQVKRWEIVFNVVLFIASLAVLIIASKYIIKYASLLAIDLGLPQIIIGLFLISIATVLPELVVGVKAVKMGYALLAIGDQIGTVVVNTTFILGIVALINPITSELIPFLIGGVFLILVSFIFVAFVQSSKKLDVTEGIALILLYVFFMILEFFLK